MNSRTRRYVFSSRCYDPNDILFYVRAPEHVRALTKAYSPTKGRVWWPGIKEIEQSRSPNALAVAVIARRMVISPQLKTTRGAFSCHKTLGVACCTAALPHAEYLSSHLVVSTKRVDCHGKSAAASVCRRRYTDFSYPPKKKTRLLAVRVEKSTRRSWCRCSSSGACCPSTSARLAPPRPRSRRCPGLTLAYYRLALCLLAARGKHAARQAERLLDCAMSLEGEENVHLRASVDLVMRMLR